MTGYFVAVAGNIGVGKSTLIGLMADKLGWAPFLESHEENPYLADFYSDMPRWGFHSQAFFLSRRLHQHYLVLQQPGPVLQDRSVYEDAEVFARNLYRQGYLTERDWQTYCDLYRTLATLLKPPNLIVYLKASVSTLLCRIARRGRDYERTISSEYLAALNELYDDWITAFTICPVLTVVTDNLDYVEHDEHLIQIVQRIQDRLHGKEVLDFEFEA